MAWLHAAPSAAVRDHAFLRLWCAKEAVLKAHGHGISFGLDRLRFEDEGGGLRLVACDPALGAPEDWSLQELQPAPDYLGALAWRPGARAGSAAATPTGRRAHRRYCAPHEHPHSLRPVAAQRRSTTACARSRSIPPLAAPLLDYLALLLRWNKTYNLTAVRDPHEMVSKHLLDSLAMHPFVDASPRAAAAWPTWAPAPACPASRWRSSSRACA